MMDKVEIFEKERAFGYNNFVEAWIPNYHYFLEILPKILSSVACKTILVAGCGNGNEIESLVKADQDWQVLGIDTSPDMLIQAREQLDNLSNVQLVEGLVSDLAKSEKFNAATLLLVLHFLEDNGEKLKILKDISDRLVPDAPFVLLDITGNESEMDVNVGILKSLLPNSLDPEKMNERLRRIRHDLFPISEERLSELCVEAGFQAPVRFFQSAMYMGWITRKL